MASLTEYYFSRMIFISDQAFTYGSLTMNTASVWDNYNKTDYEGCLRVAAEQTLQHGGLDLLAAAGASLMRLRRIEEGILLLKAAAVFRPTTVNLYHFACSLADEHVLADELAYFAVLGLRDFPDDTVLQRACATARFLQADYTSAIAHYHDVLKFEPDNVDVHLALATIHRNTLDIAAAERHYALVAEIDPHNAGVAIGRAAIAFASGDSEAARGLLQPHENDPNVQFMLAHDHLARGDYEQGWALFRSRWDTPIGKTHTKPSRPFDHVSEITGKRVVVLREGGHGDVFQFARYIPLLAARASEVILHVQPSEARLFQHVMPANVTVRPNTAMVTCYDHMTAIFDLPYQFRTTLETIPPAPVWSVPIAQPLPSTAMRRVGVVWAGGGQINANDRAYDRHRSIRLTQLASLHDFSDRIEFINLQAGPRASEPGLTLTPVLEPDGDWLDTGAIVAQLDLVITVDTAMVHLAASLGRPTWLLSRSYPCWRWRGNRPDNPWYPTVRVFGQEGDDWAPTIAAIHRALAIWLQPAVVS